MPAPVPPKAKSTPFAFSGISTVKVVRLCLRAIFAAKSEWLKINSSFYDKKPFLYIMPEERSIDIDYEYQFIMAEALIKKRLIDLFNFTERHYFNCKFSRFYFIVSRDKYLLET